MFVLRSTCNDQVKLNGVYAMLAGLSLHSFLEGFSIGHEKKDDGADDCDFHLFATYVLLTKILLAFFAGIKGVRFNDTSSTRQTIQRNI